MPRIRAANLGAHHDLMWQSLIEAFNDLAAERDSSLITLRDVAERAGMARNTIYNYVKDKNDLAAAAGRSASQSIADDIVAIARSSGPATASMVRICEIILRALQDASVRAALTRELSTSVMDVEEHWRTPFLVAFRDVEVLVERGLDDGEFTGVTDAGLAVELIAGVIGAGASRIARGDADPESLATAVEEAVLRMLGAAPSSLPTAPRRT